MTTEPSKQRPSIQVDLAARAEAKLELQATVPPSSVGRLVDAITDIFRPFSEARGLRADQIRLQREDVLIEIAKKARARLELETSPIKPVPLKFLVPYLEKASLEDIDSNLIQAWANLLVEATKKYDPKLNVYVDILSKIGGKDAQFLGKICFASKYKDGVSWPTGHFSENEDHVRKNIGLLDQSSNLKIGPNTVSSAELQRYWAEFKKETKLEYGYVIHGVVLSQAGSLFFYNRELMDVDGLTIDRLEAERLVRRTIISYNGIANRAIGTVSYLDLTYLAIDLVRVCTRSFSVPILGDGDSS